LPPLYASTVGQIREMGFDIVTTVDDGSRTLFSSKAERWNAARVGGHALMVADRTDRLRRGHLTNSSVQLSVATRGTPSGFGPLGSFKPDSPLFPFRVLDLHDLGFLAAGRRARHVESEYA
jgi:hypothetical protein